MAQPQATSAAAPPAAGGLVPAPRLQVLARITLVCAMIGVAVSYSVVYLFHVSLLVLLVAAVRHGMQGLAVRRLPDRSHWFLYFLFAWYAASVAWSLAPLYTVQYLAYLFCGICVVVTTIFYARSERTLSSLLRAVGAVITLEVLVGILETFTPFRLPISPYSDLARYFGREPVIDASLDQKAIQYLLASPTGFQWNPNDLAGTLTIFLPFCFLHRSLLIRYVGSLSMIVVIFFTGSRASYAAVVLGFLVWAIAFSARRAAKLVVALAAALLILPPALQAMRTSESLRLVQAAQLGEVLADYLKGNIARADDSVAVRRQLIANGLEALRDSSGLGVGGGASIAVQERAGGAAARITTSMHNFWVEVLVDGGVLIGSMFVLWYLWLALQCYRVAMFTRRPYLRYAATALACSLVGFSLAMVSSSSVIYVLPMWFMFGLACAVLNVERAAARDPRPSNATLTLQTDKIQ